MKQSSPASSANLANATANPVRLVTENIGGIPNYGYGFTPYFLSLGLFVGTLLMSIVLPFRETVNDVKSGVSWFLAKFTIVASVAVVQALISNVILFWMLHLHVAHPVSFVLFSILISLVFAAILHFLVSAMANPGRFLALILLILQLTSSSGTYPVMLSPEFFQHIHPYLPMTYTVSGYRYLLGGGLTSSFHRDIGVLAIIGIAFALLSLLTFVLFFRSQHDGRHERHVEGQHLLP